MGNLYRENRLYKTILLFSKIRHISIAEMCKIAQISPGIITDLKMGRKKTVQIETATKIAQALDISVELLESCPYELNDNWDVDTILMWHDADSDADKLFLLKEHGIPHEFVDEAGKMIIEEHNAAIATDIIKRITDKLQKGGPFKKLSDSEVHKAGFIQFHSEADRLTYFYSLLNDEGKRIAADRVQELSEVPKYGKHWGKEITDKITCPMSQIDEYTAKGYEVSSIQYFENGTGEGTATMVKVAPSDALQSSDTTTPENPPESAPEATENK